MPSSRDIRAGGAFVEFSLRRKGLEQSLRAVGRRLQRFGSNIARVGTRIAGLGAAITAPFALATRTFGKVGDDLDKLSRRVGISVEALSELGFAAQQSGTDMGTLERGIRSMQRNITDLGRGLSTQKDAFGALGLTFQDLADLSPEEQFTRIAAGLAKIENATERSARAQVIFGRAGSQLLPLLQDGAAGVAALRQEARDLGLTISTDTAKNAAEFIDAMGRIKSQAKVAAVNVGAALAPALLKVFRFLAKAGRAAIDFIKENRELIQVVAAVGVGLTAVGLTVVGLGGAMIVAGIAVAKLAAVIGFLLSPLGLAALAIGATTVALFRFTNLGGQAADFLKTKFAALSRIVDRTFRGIRDAIKGEDILLAVRILWTNLQLAFLEGTQGLRDKWINFKRDFLIASEEAGADAVAVFSRLFAAVQIIAVRLTAAFGRAFVNLVGDANEAFNLAVLLAKKAGASIRFAIDPTFSGQDRDAAKRQAEREFVAAQQADQRVRQGRLETLDAIRRFAIKSIEDEMLAREQAIDQSLASELEAINTAAEADKARIQERIDRLRAERRELEGQARAARLASELRERFFGVFSSRDQGLGGPFAPDLDAGLADQVQQARIAAQGVTSSFNIRSLGGAGSLENNVQQIDRKAERIERHLRDINNNLKPGVQDGGLAIV